MLTELNGEIIKQLYDKKKRIYLCENSLLYFAVFYFRDFFTWPIASFHYEMYKDLRELTENQFRYLLWVMFRESAKTSIAKIFVIWCILYRKKKFINYDSYDKTNSEAALFDIAQWLQTNEKIIEDFGQIFWESHYQQQKHATLKRINEFITTTGTKVKAYSTQESTRGRIFGRHRPDLFVMDDFETSKTKDSMLITQKIIKHIDEMKTGLSENGQIIFLGNLISDIGSIAGMVKEAEKNPKSWRYRRVDVEMNGTIMWHQKYCKTNEEAKKTGKVSLEQKKLDLNVGGRPVYEAEMMNDPAASGESVFTRKKIDELLKKTKESIRETNGLKIWQEHQKEHRYAGGADTAEGIGLDSNASCFIDFSTTPARVVASYENNRIAPDTFAHELSHQAALFGNPLLCPEVNNDTGGTTLNELARAYNPGRIYRRTVIDSISKTPTKKIGWKTTSSNKHEIFFQLRSAIENEKLEVLDERILKEARVFTFQDLKSEDAATTRHFDLLTACALAWAMREFAQAYDEEPAYKQPEITENMYW